MKEWRKNLMEFWQEHRKTILVTFLVLLVAVLSYGLGYTAALDKERAPIIIEKNSVE